MRRFFNIFLLLFAGLSLTSASELVVKTYPSEMRDDNIAYLYKDKISTISFFLFSSDDKPIEMKDVKLFIELPKGIDIISYGFSDICLSVLSASPKKYYDLKKSMNGNSCLWKLNCENQAVNRKFVPTPGEIYDNYHFYVYLEPKIKMDSAEFILKWEFQGGGISVVNGTMKVRLLPSPKNRKNPKRFFGWTEIGIDSCVIDEKELDSFLDIAKECGITGIITSQRNEKIRKANERIREKGFTLVMEPAGSNPLYLYSTLGAATFPEAEYPKDEENYQVDLRNIRVRKKADMLANAQSPMFIHAILWCPTVLARPGSEIFEKTVAELKKSYKEGFRIFYDDAEMEFYSSCYCSHCRKSFARYIKADEKEILNMIPLDLICKYPVEWYKFRCWQLGIFFKALKEAVKKDCPEILLGHNGTFSWPGSFTKNLGYGTSYMFCEDARFTDFGLDFHSADVLSGGLGDIIRLNLYFSPQDSYGVKIKKPVISRVGAFSGNNWNYFCVVGRRAYAYDQGKKLGGDKRAELLKLQIANMAALGAKGVEFSLSQSITDARVANEVDKAMEFVAEFEKMFLDGNRLDDKLVEVYDLTVEPSPYHKIGPEGYYDNMLYYGAAKKYGFVQYKTHQMKKDRLVSLFNWDLYQTKKLLIKIPDLEEGAYYVHVYTKEKRYLLISCQEKEAPQQNAWVRYIKSNHGFTRIIDDVLLPPVRSFLKWLGITRRFCGRPEKGSWSSEDLRKGISFDLEGGEIAGIYISEDKQAGYQDIRQDKVYSAEGKKPIDLYAWRDPIPPEPTIEFFKQAVFNPILNQIKQKHPEVVPEKYLKRTSYAGLKEIPKEPLGCCPVVTRVPPVVDGNLDDVGWNNAALYCNFRSVSGTSASLVKTEVYLIRDNECLYLGFRCEEPLMPNLRATARERDSWESDEDAVEVMIDPDTAGKESYYFLVNAKNTIFDERFAAGAFNKRFNTAIETAVGQEKDAWVCEIKIPLKDFGKMVEGNDLWRMNFGRYRAASAATNQTEHSTWTGKDCRQGGNGALVRFVKTAVQVRFEIPDVLRLGTNDIKVVLSVDNLNGGGIRIGLTSWDSANQNVFTVLRVNHKKETLSFPITKKGEHRLVFQIVDPDDKILFQSLPIFRRVAEDN